VLLTEFNLKNLAVVLVSFLLVETSHAQAVPQADLSFQYSHLYVVASPNANLDGPSFSGAFNYDK